MSWRWWRRGNGDAAKEARRDAEDQYRQANEKAVHVERTARAAHELARGADKFARDVERSMRRGTT
jgi:hypothetical protein